MEGLLRALKVEGLGFRVFCFEGFWVRVEFSVYDLVLEGVVVLSSTFEGFRPLGLLFRGQGGGGGKHSEP